MKYIIITILLFGMMFVASLTDIPYKIYIVVALAITIAINQVYSAISIFKRHLSGQLIIRRQKKTINPFFLVFAVLWTLLPILKHHSIYIAIFFWAIAVADIISSRIFVRRKPISIVIQNNDLLINELWVIKRNIQELNRISLNGLTDRITLSFLHKSPILIKKSDYLEKDISTLINRLVELTNQEIEITDNLRLVINGR